MEISIKSGVFIALKEVVQKQKKHLEARITKFKEKEPVRSQFFGKEKILELLNKEGCIGIKLIYGADEKGMPSTIIAAADSGLKVISKDSTGLKDPDDNSYLANGPNCPQICAPSNG